MTRPISSRLIEPTSDLHSNLERVRLRIRRACERVGRDPGVVRLLPVTKTVSASRIAEAISLGLSSFGENRVQEAREKAAVLAKHELRWSLIGHLQTNKVKRAISFASEFQALDSLRLAEALDRALERADRSLDVYIQVNTSGEASKFGVVPEAATRFASQLTSYSRLRVIGLMTIARLSADSEAARRCFGLLREVRNAIRQDGPAGMQCDGLSMGMTSDFEVAIEEGATVVRVGQALFGPRGVPDDVYWPST